jgi:hypothetical protein
MFLSFRKSVLHDASQVSEAASLRVLVRVHQWCLHDEKALEVYEFIGCPLIEFITFSALCNVAFNMSGVFLPAGDSPCMQH